MTFPTNGVALAAVHKRVRSSKRKKTRNREEVQRRSHGGMRWWEGNFMQKSARQGNGSQWAKRAGVANPNTTQTPKVVFVLHFHQCHELESKSPPKQSAASGQSRGPGGSARSDIKLQEIGNEEKSGETEYPRSLKNMSVTHCMQKKCKK